MHPAKTRAFLSISLRKTHGLIPVFSQKSSYRAGLKHGRLKEVNGTTGRLLSRISLIVFCGLFLTANSSPAAESQYTNRLSKERSPYLLQHAHNPVDWYPWGEEAFSKARRENKPIFLSIGYSTCHWCHVMEHESFENPAIAKIMNDHFVCIKVDREERPDVDSVYMTFVQATTGGGGWPMNVWLTPDLKPFVGGTYFPPQQLTSALNKIAKAWDEDRDHIVASSNEIMSELQKGSQSSGNSAGKLDAEIEKKGYQQLAAAFDAELGGFGEAPKFPRPVTLNFLDRIYAGDPDSKDGRHALEMTLVTLRKMAEGGIHDHLGAGSTATPLINSGTSRTSRRCSTIRPSSRLPTSMPFRSPATRSLPKPRGISLTTFGAT